MRLLCWVAWLSTCLAGSLSAQTSIGFAFGASGVVLGNTSSVEVGAFVALRSEQRAGIRFAVDFAPNLDVVFVGPCLTSTPSPRGSTQAYGLLGLAAVISTSADVTSTGTTVSPMFTVGLGLRTAFDRTVFGFAELRMFTEIRRGDAFDSIGSARAGLQVRL